jgi:penicillin-binding protein 1A
MFHTPYIKQIIIIFITATIIGASCCLGMFWYVLYNHTIDFSALEQYTCGTPSVVLDIHGVEWARFQLDRRDPITLQQMPPHLLNAFIAIEDWHFFKHSGLSWKGIARSVLYNLYYGRKVQGASTITQQLVRLLFFDTSKTFVRKIKEQLYALLVEQRFSKEQILQTYLNHVYFGCGIYGVEAASQRFWKKSAMDLTLDEAATLAGIVRSPGNYCPLLYPLSAQKRRNVVLNSMAKLKFITNDEYTVAREQQVIVVEQDQKICAPHLKEFLRQFLEEMVGKELLYSGGLTIQTTLDRTMQQQAEEVFEQQVQKLRTEISPELDGALLTIEVTTGEIRAMIGGLNFKKSKFNRAFQARRQVGSVLKPLLYAAARQEGLQFFDTEYDEPYSLSQQGKLWQPKNFNGRFEGCMTLARALIISSNIVAIKTLLKIGPEKLVALAQKCHITGPLEPYPALALGCVDATLKEVAGMFNIFAHQGVYVEPHPIRWIKDALGTKIWRYQTSQEAILDACIAGSVAKVLITRSDMARATWSGAPLKCQALSKTGTTNDSRTCWFAGSTPDLTTIVYVGCDDNRPLGKYVYPARTAFPIWMAFHTLLEHKQQQFSFDPRLRQIIVHSKTGQWLPNATSCPEGLTLLV